MFATKTFLPAEFFSDILTGDFNAGDLSFADLAQAKMLVNQVGFIVAHSNDHDGANWQGVVVLDPSVDEEKWAKTMVELTDKGTRVMSNPGFRLETICWATGLIGVSWSE